MNIPYLAQQFFDNTGNPLSGGKLYTYTAGSTSLPKPLYYDSTLTIPSTNPLILDASGRPGQFYMTSGGYNFVLKSSADVLICGWDYQFGTTSNITSGGSVSDSYKVAVDQYDTNPDYLVNKLDSGAGIDVIEVIGATRIITVNSQGKMKTTAGDSLDYLGTKFTNTSSVTFSAVNNKMTASVVLSAVQTTLDHKVCVDSEDIDAPNYLIEKIVGEYPVSVTSESSGQHKQLHIGVPDFGMVKVNVTDVEGYVADKIKAGAGITITSATDVEGTKLYINSRTNVWLPTVYVSSNYTVKDTDCLIVIRGNFSDLTIPTPSAQYEGRKIFFQCAGIGYSTTVQALSGSIVGNGNTVITNYNKLEVVCVNDGSSWIWIAS
jgi:hypothetical protein